MSCLQVEIYLVCRLAHELLCWLFPYSRHGDHPSDVVVQYLRRRLIRQFLEAVLLEKFESVSEDFQCEDAFSIGRFDLDALVEILCSRKKGGGILLHQQRNS